MADQASEVWEPPDELLTFRRVEGSVEAHVHDFLKWLETNNMCVARDGVGDQGLSELYEVSSAEVVSDYLAAKMQEPT